MDDKLDKVYALLRAYKEGRLGGERMPEELRIN